MRYRAQQISFRMKTSVLAVMVAGFLLALSAPALAAPFTARLSAPNHTPIATKKWPITITVTRGHTKLSGSVKYQFLFQGQLESTQPGKSFKGGVYHDSLTFPKEAVGFPLTLRIVVKTSYGTVDIDWSVKVRA